MIGVAAIEVSSKCRHAIAIPCTAAP
jgi:hypothetical protein